MLNFMVSFVRKVRRNKVDKWVAEFTKKIPNNSQINRKEMPLMIVDYNNKSILCRVNHKLIGRGKTNLKIINKNNIDKDYEITNRNISVFS